jgi:hypothetical protein
MAKFLLNLFYNVFTSTILSKSIENNVIKEFSVFLATIIIYDFKNELIWKYHSNTAQTNRFFIFIELKRLLN